ncbi:hypothetical protein Tco_0671734 [Tanacetum coccineum]
MYSITSWNIRGLNRTPKQTDNENNLNVCAILESHVDIGKLDQRALNGSFCAKGSRIILCWNEDVVDAMVLSRTSQAMHTKVMLKADRKALIICTFVYASNSYVRRWETPPSGVVTPGNAVAGVTTPRPLR